jgi:hypothetical protein
MRGLLGNGRYASVTATLALIVALGGTGYAAVGLANNSVGTPQLKANAVVSSMVKNGSLLKKDFKAGQIPAGPRGAAGPAGPVGATGAIGATGATGAAGAAGPVLRWALINAAGTAVLAQTGGISIHTHPFAGETFIDFGTATAGHAVWAQQSDVDNLATEGAASAAPCGAGADIYPNCAGAINANLVHVGTHNAAGTLADRTFYVFFMP